MLYFPCFYIYKNLIFKIKGTNTLLIFVLTEHKHSKICINFFPFMFVDRKFPLMFSSKRIQQKQQAQAAESAVSVLRVTQKAWIMPGEMILIEFGDVMRTEDDEEEGEGRGG